MGCGSSKPATKDATPIEKAASEPVGPIGARKKTSEPGSENIAKKLSPLPTSGLVPVEFGLVKGLEFGPKSAPALLVVQVCATAVSLASTEKTDLACSKPHLNANCAAEGMVGNK